MGRSEKKTGIDEDIIEIGETLASISEMSDIRSMICDLGGRIVAAEDDDMLVKCDDAKAVSRRIRGSLSNVVVGELDGSTLFLRRMRQNA